MNDDLKKALEVLQDGGTILYPTDTVWGIGCDATHPEAVKKVYQIKQREDSKSMLVLVDSEVRLERYVAEVPEVAWQLIEVADKPMTLIYPGAKNLAANLIAPDGSIGIRLVKDDFCRQLIQRLKKPIVSTSANISGQPTPAGFDQIAPEILRAVDYVVTWRQDDPTAAQPSSIIAVGLGGQIRIIRK